MSTRNSSSSGQAFDRRTVEAGPGFRELPREAIAQSLPARFEAQARTHADKLALKTRAAALSYGELNGLANRVAREILERRGGAEEPAVLLLSQEAPLVAAILGALKAGKLYVPLDPAHPRAAIAAAAAQTSPGLILTDFENRSLAEELSGDRILVVNAEEAAASGDAPNPGRALSPDAGACVFHTSGSTGRPKGVVDVHRNVLHNVRRYTNSLKFGPDDRMSLIQSCSFSGTVSTLFGALCNGAAVLLFDLRREGPARLAQWLAEERVTIYHSVPAIFRAIFDGGRRFPDLRLVRLEGDQAYRIDAELHRRHLASECVLVNGLGATETGLTRQYVVDVRARLDGERIPAGYPVEDMHVLLLDEGGGPAAEGASGEIAVESRYLARGYWKRPDLDRAAFLPVPGGDGLRIYRTGDLGRLRPDGCLELLGRRDFRVKIRGQQVDPADVERALLRIDGISQAVVASREERPGQPRLVAYFVASGRPAPPAAALRRGLAAVLPEAMVPSAFVALASLPLDDNGKVVRHGLPDPPRTPEGSAPFAAPRGPLERRLARVWKAALGTRRVGVLDDFFELGGDSLSAARAAAEIEDDLRRPVPPALIFAHPTIARLARALEEDAARFETGEPLLPIQPGGSRPPLYLVPNRLGELHLVSELARALGDDQPLYAYRWTGGAPRRPPPRRVEEMAADCLGRIRRIQPAGPYRLGGLCFGAVVAVEMARQLRAEGESIALLALIGISPYDFSGLVAPEALARYLAPRRSAGLAERAAAARARFSRRAGRQNLAWIGAKARSLPRILGNEARRMRDRAVSGAGDLAWSAAGVWSGLTRRPRPSRPRDADRFSRRAFASYAPKPDPGPVVVVLAGRTRATYSEDPASDFRGLTTGPLFLHEIDCQDGWMLIEPHVAELARCLAGHLRKASPRGQGGR